MGWTVWREASRLSCWRSSRFSRLTIGDLNAAKIIIVLAGAVIGFLFFNLPWPLRGQHRTFMGDAGSMVLGFAIAWFSVSLTQQNVNNVPPPTMLWVLGLLLMDVFTVTVRRLARRRSPMSPDRDHIHHILMRRGYSPRATLAMLVAANALLALHRHELCGGSACPTGGFSGRFCWCARPTSRCSSCRSDSIDCARERYDDDELNGSG